MPLAGCALEGVVVEKHSRPLPDASMIGTEGAYSFAFRGPTGTSRPPITVPVPQLWTQNNGIYTFLLRDQAGSAHSQMVTAEAFARSRVGDSFDDRQCPLKTADSKDKTITAVSDPRPHCTIGQTHPTHRKSARHAPSGSEIPNHQIPSQGFNLQTRIGDASFF